MNCVNRIKMCAFGCIAAIVAIAGSCTDTEPPVTAQAQPPYFSLETYFKAEAARLQKLAPPVSKTVNKNGAQETHTVEIGKWENELMLFIESDINKSAWRQSYQMDSVHNTVVYRSLEPELRTRQITVERHENGDIKHIGIQNGVANMLYRSDEKLDYYPDSLYRIDKKQHVAIIGENAYTITGAFIQP